jgi:hypothetical protein
MKTNSLEIKAFLAVLMAIIFLPVSGTAAAIAFTVTGMLSVMLADYGRNLEPLRATADILPFRAAESLREAA